MGANPGQIVVQGNGYDLSVAAPVLSPIVRGSNTAELRVPAGQTLALIGGDIAINGGTLTAEQGRIELGSLRDGQVNLGAEFAFSYPEVQTFGSIRLSRQALVDASGGGSIQVQGNQVSLADGSIMLIQNQGTQAGGSISVNAAQSLELSGTNPDGNFPGGLDSETVGVGQGANIIISTQQLITRGGAATSARSYSPGDAGNVTVNASDSVQLIGFSPINPNLLSVIGNAQFNAGNGGEITVSTRRLTALDGGSVTAANFGTGRGGTVTVNATETLELIGVTPLLLPSNVDSNVVSTGDGGTVTINTARLVLRDGGSINSSNVGSGNGGSVTVNASESVEVSGRVRGAFTPTIIGSSAVRPAEVLQKVFGLPDRPSGNSGSLTVNTPRLNISDGARVAVSNVGTGNAGTLRVNANSISLDRGGSITAATASGEGGNIDLNVRDFVLLRNNSPITASAGGTGNGGNIRIDAGLIVAIPSENSDISANSTNARGGNITINTSGIFGTQFRPQDTPLSDITATGANSQLNGIVKINVQDVDPTRGLTQLPTEVVDASRLVATGCRASQGSSFVVTGRGGLPPTPKQTLGDDPRWRDWRTMAGISGQPSAPGNGTLPPSAKPPSTKSALVEATGWVIKSDGKVMLTASAPNVTSLHQWEQSVNCNGSL
jgi:large exoprotein involved in heme utilization and adhesion